MTIATYPDLAGKVAVVTGGSKGIGAAASVLLGHNGARVAVCGRDPETIESVTAETRDAGAADAAGLAADLNSPEGAARLRAEVEERLGSADVLMAFAGGFGARTPLLETELDEWNAIVESNLTSTACRGMRRSSRSSTRWRVSGVSGACTERKSASAASSPRSR